ncbi:hypothetical protein F8M41_025587 [Gigaspora margarita]|uniref:Uncharacterized protein n=1 Tax=Gigaspora margarita TaxID=4874 RepID=A0A8H3XKB5_GIGMA|nr:hypothetical protein F8M41_025587 [Gigaspora margarita]
MRKKKESEMKNTTMLNCCKNYLALAPPYYRKKSEKNPDIHAILGPEDLFVNLNRDFSRKILTGIEDEDSIFGSYRTDKVGHLRRYYQDNASHKKFDHKKEEKMETVLTKPREMADGKALEFLS